ncbi:hypothetical protein HF519_20810 [Pseudonocardia bannensis]|uniref:Uncharacterized protein n=1 Tax=Pseudonocardia bannensis TaxID=630973 RepID=A0A848DML0_9PSEU|nr:hypothetical protein [Pseudonocardia bannensis]NMH93972.1 hypothetical protein [Pseudonocardia bannensis]
MRSPRWPGRVRDRRTFVVVIGGGPVGAALHAVGCSGAALEAYRAA